MRPANVVTAVADVLAGTAIAGYFIPTVVYSGGFWWGELPPNTFSAAAVLILCLSTIGLYSGGIILNDVFDAELDKIERPERPIPSGLISRNAAAVFGGIFFFIGVFAAGLYSKEAQYLAIAIMVSCLVYDKYLKHHSFFGPLNMGLCRGFNLLLGISIVSGQVQQLWYLAVIPVLYIAAITMISRGEVHGGSRHVLYFAASLYLLVIGAIAAFGIRNAQVVPTLIFLGIFAVMIFIPLFKALKNPTGPNIGKAVKSGVIALILMNAAWASAFGVWHVAILISLLLPLSLVLSKAFAVT